MSQASQATPTVTANISGSNHQVNLRDYLNIRVAPFLKKAITESLDAAPEFPLQWLGENLIHQSLLFEGNPDRTKIQERFLYKFETPVASADVTRAAAPAQEPVQPQPELQPPAMTAEESASVVPVANGGVVEAESAQDVQMSNHVNGTEETAQPNDEPRDTEMAETTHE